MIKLILLLLLIPGIPDAPDSARSMEPSDPVDPIADSGDPFADPGGPIARADAAYAEGRFGEALALYEKALEDPEAPRGPLLYNRGNCAFRMGRHAEAVLHYRRALMRLPRDEALRFNLALAEGKLGIEAPPFESFGSAVEALAGAFTPAEFLILMAVLQAVGLFGWLLLRGRRSLTRGAMLLLVVLGVAGSARILRTQVFPEPPEAVVLSSETLLRAEPHRSRPVIGKLDAGRTVKVEAYSDRWARVDHPSGWGWVERDYLGLLD